MKKIVIMIMLTLSLQAFSSTYDVKYKGVRLGEIRDLSTLEDLYLKAEVTSRVARFLLGKDSVVFYAGDKKPDVAKAKFKKDKKMMLFAFKESLKNRPKFKRFEISPIKNITLSCQGNSCQFFYYKNNKINGKGTIRFDDDNNFLSLSEELSDVEIVRN